MFKTAAVRAAASPEELVAPGGERITLEYIDVATAAKYLAYVDPRRQRQLNQSRVSRWTREMANNRWADLAPTAIIFDEAGRLINGQHTLHAIVDSNRGQTLLVIRNFPSRFIYSIDPATSGRTNLEACQAGFGLDITKNEAAVLRVVATAPATTKPDWTPPEFQSEWARWGGSVRWIVGLAHPRSHLTRAPILAAFARASYYYDLMTLEPLLSKFLAGEDPLPLRLLRDKITRVMLETRLNSNANKFLYQWSARAVLAAIKGEQLTKIQSPKEADWDPFPPRFVGN